MTFGELKDMVEEIEAAHEAHSSEPIEDLEIRIHSYLAGTANEIEIRFENEDGLPHVFCQIY